MTRWAAAVILALLASGACANPSTSGAASKDEIEITMRDSVFEPKKVTVKRGEEVTFRFVNRGSLEHEAFIGEASEQKAHERAMGEDGEMSGHHMDDDTSVSVKPGKSATLTHTFTERGQTLIGCHVPGHYAGGMRVKVTVT